jgi:flagellar basal-body rod modification protein FlgD
MESLGVNASAGRDQFLQLLVTQMRNQNPLEPMKDAEFIAQLAQFSTLEGVERLNTNFEDMLKLQQLTEGASLVGRIAVYDRADAATPGRGLVQGVVVDANRLQLMINDSRVPLDAVRGLTNA